MSATEEPQPPAVEAPPPAEEPKKEEKPVGEKKTRAPKEKKAKTKTASHPPYFQMIKEALIALNEKSGSSPYAIAKYMEEKHKAALPVNFRKTMALQLKNSAARGKLIKIKASYKLSEAGKKDKAAKVSKPKAEKKTEEKKKSMRAITKKGGKKNKKSGPAKPKQPKSIKSPASKKPKKGVA